MKKLLILLIPIIASFTVMAQPTLTNSTTSPVAGDKFYEHGCDLFGVSKGTAGAGVTWDMSALTQIYLDSLTYGPCIGTPYCDSFPGSNLSIDYGGGYYEYYIADTNKFAQSGDGDMSYMDYYPDPFALITYPMAYGPTFKTVDTMILESPKGGFYGGGIDTLEADGYGTLILPSGTYTNVLRVRMHVALTDSDLSTTPATVDTQVADVYMWWTPGFHNPLLMMSYDTLGGGALQGVSYYTKPAPPLMPSSVAPLNAGAGIRTYPNPATDNVHIVLSALAGGSATIATTDMVGRSIGEPQTVQLANGNNNINYSVSSLPAGIYLLRIQSDGNSVVKKIEVIK